MSLPIHYYLLMKENHHCKAGYLVLGSWLNKPAHVSKFYHHAAYEGQHALASPHFVHPMTPVQAEPKRHLHQTSKGAAISHWANKTRNLALALDLPGKIYHKTHTTHHLEIFFVQVCKLLSSSGERVRNHLEHIGVHTLKKRDLSN